MGKTAIYYMGKIGIVYMGNINGSKNDARVIRAEQERLHDFTNPRRSGDTGQQSESFGNQSQRVNRAHGSYSPFFPNGNEDTGGTVSQLIHDYQDQVASKEALIKQTQEEIDYLQSRIRQFEKLVSNLEKTEEQK